MPSPARDADGRPPDARRRARARTVIRACAALVALAAAPPPAASADAAGELRARAYEAAYNLDHDEAVQLFQRALALDPQSPAAHRALATVSWLSIAFGRGTVTADEYIGGAPRQTLELPPPPPEPARLFAEHAGRALQLAEARVRRHPRDADAHYELGATVGLQASYMASVEGKLFAAFRLARRAYSAHERVLELDPSRHDAGLIVGTYRYVVSTLSLPGRWFAYVAGFGGGRERGLQLIEQAAAHGGEVQTEARFALILLYNREKRYGDALQVLAGLRRRYPRNRLLWLESGATALRDGSRAAEAEQFLRDGLARLARDDRRRIFGEDALWHYKLGEALLARGERRSAHEHLHTSLQHSAREWVRARTHLALGRIAEREGRRDEARAHYGLAIKFGESGRDAATVTDAKHLIRGR